MKIITIFFILTVICWIIAGIIGTKAMEDKCSKKIYTIAVIVIIWLEICMYAKDYKIIELTNLCEEKQDVIDSFYMSEE